jgi:16S rRNA processing protein RimM
MVVLGRVAGIHGLHGWVKVFSETEPRENILSYSPWYLGASAQPREVLGGGRRGKGLVARLGGCSDRDRAAGLVGMEIAVRRDQLPPATVDELYWTDLEGLRVETESGDTLGRVHHLFSTGANDVLVVRGSRERLVPFLWATVVEDVDFERGLIRVRWDPDF